MLTAAAVVGQTTIKPGGSTTVSLAFTMSAGMGGPHEFALPLKSNDPGAPDRLLIVRSNWVPR